MKKNLKLKSSPWTALPLLLRSCSVTWIGSGKKAMVGTSGNSFLYDIRTKKYSQLKLNTKDAMAYIYFYKSVAVIFYTNSNSCPDFFVNCVLQRKFKGLTENYTKIPGQHAMQPSEFIKGSRSFLYYIQQENQRLVGINLDILTEIAATDSQDYDPFVIADNVQFFSLMQNQKGHMDVYYMKDKRLYLDGKLIASLLSASHIVCGIACTRSSLFIPTFDYASDSTEYLLLSKEGQMRDILTNSNSACNFNQPKSLVMLEYHSCFLAVIAKHKLAFDIFAIKENKILVVRQNDVYQQDKFSLNFSLSASRIKNKSFNLTFCQWSSVIEMIEVSFK